MKVAMRSGLLALCFAGCLWDVPVAEVAELPSVRAARKEFEKAAKKERYFV